METSRAHHLLRFSRYLAVAAAVLGVGASLTLASSPAWAGDAAPAAAPADDVAPSTGQVMGDLGSIMAKTQLTNAAADLLTAQTKLRQAEQAYAAVSGRAPATQDSTTSNTAGGQPAPPPTVRGVYGSNGVRWATLSYAAGDVHDVRPGETVQPGCVLGDVSVSRVTMKCADKVSDLTFSANPPAMPVVGHESGVPQVPNGMPLSGMPPGAIPPGMMGSSGLPGGPRSIPAAR
jgi:type IV pilus biogenesis protein PilP